MENVARTVSSFDKREFDGQDHQISEEKETTKGFPVSTKSLTSINK